MIKNLLLSLASVAGLASTVPALAQDCSLFSMKKGSSYEMTSYDHKDRVTNRVVQHVTDVTTSAGVVTATLHQQQFDDKGKPVMESDYTIECSGGTLRLDMRAMANSAQMQKGMEGMQVEITGDKLDMPLNPTVGQKLPDGTFSMKGTDKNSGMAMMTMNMHITDRLVAGREKQTTPAGSFDCVKVSQMMKMENIAMGIPIRFDARSISWYAPGVGPVRTESYRGDKLMGYTLLTKITN